MPRPVETEGESGRLHRAWLFASALALVAAGWAWFLRRSGMGTLAFTSIGADWAHHLALVEVYFAGKTQSEIAGTLTFMSIYPPLGHWLTAEWAKLSGTTPLEAFQCVSELAILIGAVSVAGLMTRDFRRNLRAGIFFGLGAALLALVSHLGLGFWGMVAVNSFFAELICVSLSLALYWGLEAFVENGSPRRLVLGALFCLPVVRGLLAIHAIGGVWFAGAAILVIATSAPATAKARWIAGAATALGLGLAVVTDPHLHAMRVLSKNDGAIQFLPFWDSGHWRPLGNAALIVLSVAVFALVLGAAARIQAPRRIAAIRRHAPFLSGLLLLAAQWGALGLGNGSYYAVKKELAFALLLLPISLARWPRNAEVSAPASAPRAGLLLLSLAMALAFGVQKPLPHFTRSQKAWIAHRAWYAGLGTAATPRPPEERLYPQSEDDPAVNYYFAIGILGLPTDSQTLDWLYKGTHGERPLAPPPASP